MHTKFETVYSYNTMNVLFKFGRAYVVVHANNINKHLLMDLVEFFDFGHIDPYLKKVALRMSDT